MRNRAKCKLCRQTIESLHKHDYVTCSCGEISVDGGTDYFRCIARDFSNFLRLDDDDNEIICKVIEKEDSQPLEPIKKITKLDVLAETNRLIESIEKLPPQAMQASVTHSDLLSVLWLLAAALRLDCKDES